MSALLLVFLLVGSAFAQVSACGGGWVRQQQRGPENRCPHSETYSQPCAPESRAPRADTHNTQRATHRTHTIAAHHALQVIPSPSVNSSAVSPAAAPTPASPSGPSLPPSVLATLGGSLFGFLQNARDSQPGSNNVTTVADVNNPTPTPAPTPATPAATVNPAAGPRPAAPLINPGDLAALGGTVIGLLGGLQGLANIADGVINGALGAQESGSMGNSPAPAAAPAPVEPPPEPRATGGCDHACKQLFVGGGGALRESRGGGG